MADSIIERDADLRSAVREKLVAGGLNLKSGGACAAAGLNWGRWLLRLRQSASLCVEVADRITNVVDILGGNLRVNGQGQRLGCPFFAHREIALLISTV